VLVVAPSALDRPSTPQLRLLLEAMVRRPDVTVDVWFLRPIWYGDVLEPLPTSGRPPWIVDELRTWPPGRALEAIGLGRVAAGLRGLRLRRRLREVGPDLVLLDDGVGDRILGPGEARAVRVARLNADVSPAAGLEAVATDGIDLWLTVPGGPAPAGAGAERSVSGLLGEHGWARRQADPEVRARLRRSVGLEPDAFVVSGWGGTSWVDGPDLFVRALWALEAHHGIRAHGLWVAIDPEPQDVARLEAEAERCGVGDRFHLVSGDDELRLCGDAALLPYRCEGDAFVLDALAAGLAVVAFEAVGWEDEGIEVVADLDVDAAAAALAAVDPSARDARVEAARHRLDPDGLVDELLDLVTGR
jgi:hypothetical protein